jgi:hypothetical protein
LPGGVAPSVASKSGNVSTAKAKPKAKADEKAVPAEVKGTPEEPLYAKYEKMLMDEREASKADREQAKYARMLEAGLGILGGTSQYALENIGKGAAPALKGYGEDVRGLRSEERGRVKELLGIEGMRQDAKRSAQDVELKKQIAELKAKGVGSSATPTVIQGPPGPAGPAGPAGPPGPAGPAGPMAYIAMPQHMMAPAAARAAAACSAAVASTMAGRLAALMP